MPSEARLAPDRVEPRQNGNAPRVRTGFAVRAAISLGLLGIILYAVDLGEVLDLIRRTAPVPFAACVAALFLDRIAMAAKWSLLTAARGIRLGVWQSSRIYLVSSFIGLFLPTGVGGDIYRIYRTSRQRGRIEEVAASVVIERFIGIVANALVAALGLIALLRFHPGELLDPGVSAAIFGFLVLGAAAFWLSMQEFTGRLLDRWSARWSDSRVVSKLLAAQRAYLGYRAHRGTLATFLGLSVAEQVWFATANYAAGLAVGLELGPVYFLALIPICRIVIRIPVSINAIGVQEGMFVLLFTGVGVSSSQAFSLALVARVAHWLAIAPGYLLYLTDGARRDPRPGGAVG